jgi:hypothetical protein
MGNVAKKTDMAGASRVVSTRSEAFWPPSEDTAFNLMKESADAVSVFADMISAPPIGTLV